MPHTVKLNSATAWDRAIKALLMGFLIATHTPSVANAATQQKSLSCVAWPLLDAYFSQFVQEDGRVIDFIKDKNVTTSEGQAYSLFFALVANDKIRFDKILSWTKYNLASGDLTTTLPAWLWGQRQDGSWNVIDKNSAADADMWIAYTLIQAGNLWNDSYYQGLGIIVLANIVKQEVVDLPSFGKIILPAPQGFALENDTWRLNPSYFPIQLIKSFSVSNPRGPWKEIESNTLKLLKQSSPLGFSPDWITYNAKQGWMPDINNGPTGSYDAIRVYLWLGMLAQADPSKKALLNDLHGMKNYLKTNNFPPQKVDTLTGKAEGNGPLGFSGALLPYLFAIGNHAEIRKQKKRVFNGNKKLIGSQPAYYDQVLTLFGSGWLDQRFKFDINGQLLPKWKTSCHDY